MLVRLYKLHWSDKDGIIASFAILADDDVFAGHALPLFFHLMTVTSVTVACCCVNACSLFTVCCDEIRFLFTSSMMCSMSPRMDRVIVKYMLEMEMRITYASPHMMHKHEVYGDMMEKEHTEMIMGCDREYASVQQ
jgi:hypothetical protein